MFPIGYNDIRLTGRPRKGAWIEMRTPATEKITANSRPRKGAWIEIQAVADAVAKGKVAPARGRGLKSA